ncbi:MAG TPA: hypothetical protein VL068_00185 [Microthrixaceae bacterium]|nr:hypothetical protein [Microthrixaceae bacterium]
MDGIDWSQSKTNSISSASGRLVVDRVRTVQVRPEVSTKVQITALLDLLDLHLSNIDAGQQVDPTQVTLRVPTLTSEARGALGTLVEAFQPSTKIHILELDSEAQWRPAEIGWNPADLAEYARWPTLLSRSRQVPALVSTIIETADLPGLRAYPRLSSTNGWSLRLEGLEVGLADAKHAVLKVGKEPKGPAPSHQRSVWVESTGNTQPLTTNDPLVAAKAIRSFAEAWHGLAETSTDQDEHALESRILRGACAVLIDDHALTLIKPDSVVNWGSQFPTKWGPGGSPRYLDALLRDGSTPWAVEMKVQGGTGVGQYYRHAVAQAVLYREFIRKATPLSPWFESHGLVATSCRAAVVVPRVVNSTQQHWRDNTARLCDAFELALVEVEPEHALRH